MASFRYPLFYADSDGWMKVIRSDKALAVALEFNDIDGEAYRCWDAAGTRIALGWDRKRVVAASEGTPDADGLVAAIREYAKLERISTQMEAATGGAVDALTLWEEVEARIKMRGN